LDVKSIGLKVWIDIDVQTLSSVDAAGAPACVITVPSRRSLASQERCEILYYVRDTLGRHREP
jgi:hypothetical protein